MELKRLQLSDYKYYVSLAKCYNLDSSEIALLMYHGRLSAAYLLILFHHIMLVCINQANSTEKKAQVGSMDEIYRNDTCVSVWLGSVPVPDMFLPQTPELLQINTSEIEGFDWVDEQGSRE